MISFALTFFILFLALNVAFYIGAYARCDDTLPEFWHAIRWSFRNEVHNILFCKFVLWMVALIFTMVFHVQFVRDIIVG